MLMVVAATAQNIKVLSYNLRNSHANDGDHSWPYRKDKVAEIMKRADLIGCQEVLHDMLVDLEKRMPDYDHVGVGRNNGKKKGEYAPIFFRKDRFELIETKTFWLSETPDKVGVKGWDAALPRICTWAKLKDKQTGRVFYAFNTHFDHKGVNARRQSAALITERMKAIAGDAPLIFTGDLNMQESDPGYTTLVQSGLQDASHTAAAKNGPTYSDCGFDVTNKKCSKIDYVFYKSGWKALSVTISDEHEGKYYPSDHLPVFAELQPE